MSRRWRRIGRIAFAVFLVAVAVLLVRQARSVDWGQVRASLAGYDAATLAAAAALALASYGLYACYDLAARRYAGHGVGTGRVVAIALASYAFNLNLGALIGGAGFRYRLYLQAGVGAADVGRVLGFSVTTNWLGYALVAGVLFSARAVPLPRGWELGMDGLQALGVALLLACAAYLGACVRWHGRAWRVRGHEVRLPRPGLAVLQFALAGGNWLLIAAIHWLLLRGAADYPAVVGVTLLAAVAAAITHIPAGVGALETVFLALLGGDIGKPALLGALLVYRALYYLGPLLLAVAGYLALEAAGRRARG